MYRVFRPSVEGSTKGTSPECAAGPRDVPKVDPDTRGQENPISMSTDKSIGITFCVSHGVATPMRDTPKDDLSIRKSNAFNAHPRFISSFDVGVSLQLFYNECESAPGKREITLRALCNVLKRERERVSKWLESYVRRSSCRQ